MVEKEVIVHTHTTLYFFVYEEVIIYIHTLSVCVFSYLLFCLIIFTHYPDKLTLVMVDKYSDLFLMVKSIVHHLFVESV